MIERTLSSIAFSNSWGRQMRFITGPRQAGKTTLAKLQLERSANTNLYYAWDSRSVRERYKNNELFFTADAPPKKDKKNWICFDEIHKIPRWKNILKSIFDETQEHYQFIVTGSAKLGMFKRAGDSLSGRYFAFHLFPLTLREVRGHPVLNEEDAQGALDFILKRLNNSSGASDAVDDLLNYGGFPEPFLRHSSAFRNKWSRDHLDRVITEDIGLLTRITDRDKMYDLYQLLPAMTASPLSENSLASHLESNPVTIKNYLKRLEDFYLVFRLPPYSKNIKRSLLKASKCYLYDWTKIEDQAKRFENYAAVELYALTRALEDLSGTNFRLSYVRDKNKRETDFLILRENKPWMLVEIKLSDGPVESHHALTARSLGGIPVVQVCRQENIAMQEKKNIFKVSASRFFA